MHFFKNSVPNSCRPGLAAVAGCLLAFGMLIGCAGGKDYGGLVGVEGIYDEMRKGPIGSDYQYFKTPAVARPNAIIAVHKKYTLKTGTWSAIDFGTGESQGWRVYRGSMGSSPMLLEIQGPGGEHIGLWYSVYTSTVVKMLGDNVVQIFPPTVDTERRDR